ncbi:MAG: Endoribonuclease EndoA [Chlamydiae bacterium]|nr:Endoribonuclease EndoA [Chlamydiota bacterium]
MSGKVLSATEPMSGRKNDFPKRGDIYWVNLDPTIGGETKKTRPALIISNDIGNETSKIVIVAPITSKVKNVYPFEVKTFVNGKAAKVMLNQCRAVDKSRLITKIGSIEQKNMKSAEDAIKIVFGLN